MAAEKRGGRVEPRPQAQTAASSTTRKPWVKKSTVDVVLEQIQKQETKVAEMEEAIKEERKTLTKLQKAKEVLEAK